MTDEKWEILDIKALGTIRLCLVVLVTFNISKETTTKDLLRTLAKLSEKILTTNQVFFMKRLFNTKMLKCRFVDDHLNEFNTVINQSGYLGVNLDDEVRALL